MALLRQVQDEIGDFDVASRGCEVENGISSVNGHLDGHVLAFSSRRQASQAECGQKRRRR